MTNRIRILKTLKLEIRKIELTGITIDVLKADARKLCLENFPDADEIFLNAFASYACTLRNFLNEETELNDVYNDYIKNRRLKREI